MGEKRKDPKGRLLRTGENYDQKSGRYRYSYVDAKGKRRCIYSWTLTKNDSIPVDKKQKPGMSLREREVEVRKDVMEAIDSSGGKMSVENLMERYINLRMKEVRESTRSGYRTQLRFIQEEPFGRKHINSITPTEAEEWFDYLYEKRGKNYSTLCTLRGILRPAFAMAKKNRWILDNPFDFSLNRKRFGGTKTRDALSRADMRRFLDFMRTDPHFSKYFYGTFILFQTGLRISEFCGLTPDDIDFKEHVIHVRRQLIRIHDGEKTILFIERPKTENGVRDVPMIKDVEVAFQEVMKARPKIKEQVIWDEGHTESATGFLWIDKDGHYEVSQHWSNHLRWATAKFNRIYKDEIPQVTPHICRHTFCSNLASAGMSPKTLQVIMGHSSVEVTLNVYTHLEVGDIKAQFFGNKQYEFYTLNRVPAVISLETEGEKGLLEEGEPDFSEVPDDDD